MSFLMEKTWILGFGSKITTNNSLKSFIEMDFILSMYLERYYTVYRNDVREIISFINS